MRGSFISLLLLFLETQNVHSYKFLCFSPQYAVSHVNYLAKISDTLVEAGHEVVILAPRFDPAIRGARSKKARVIELPENEYTRRAVAANKRGLDRYWNTSILALAAEGSELFEATTAAMNETIHHPGLIEQLREEKFDAAFAEEPAGFGVFEMVGIEKTAWTISFASFEFAHSLTQMPSNPSYVPSIFSSWGDRMTFFERVKNLLASCGWGLITVSRISWLQPIFEADLWESTAANSLVFLNAEPLLDYPRPTSHRVVEIGGITTAAHEGEPLNEYWSEVLSRRPRNIIFSFGTYIKTSAMPENYKETIRKALAKFPDVTFIWKYENPEHNVTLGIPNVVETTWFPQVAILNDPRLTAFITHGGQGGTLEAAYAGIPMLLIPTQGDQYRNAAMITRAGLGNVIELNDLEGGSHLEEAIRDLLENKEYDTNAKRVAKMLKEKPFTATEKLVRNMEFLAAHGPLRMLDHEGRNMGFMQYYLIDVFLFIGTITMIVLLLILVGFRACFRCFCNRMRRKDRLLKRD